MKVFLDTEFLEGEQDKRFFGFKYGKTKPTIDLISIGLVSEDGREYYAVSKEFNLHEAWNRYDLVDYEYSQKKVYWIRENVLKPIYNELASFHVNDYHYGDPHFGKPMLNSKYLEFNYKSLKWLINKYGKTREQIAEEVFQFCTQDSISIEKAKHYDISYPNIDLYSYYGAYDHVAFCWLFGKMIDLPKGFPMHSKDLKQTLDEKQVLNSEQKRLGFTNISDLKHHPQYPKQYNEHNALADARWNKKLYEFLKTI